MREDEEMKVKRCFFAGHRDAPSLIILPQENIKIIDLWKCFIVKVKESVIMVEEISKQPSKEFLRYVRHSSFDGCIFYHDTTI